MYWTKRKERSGKAYYSFVQWDPVNQRNLRLRRKEVPYGIETDEQADQFCRLKEAEHEAACLRIRRKLEWKNKFYNFSELLEIFKKEAQSMAPNSWENMLYYLEHYAFPFFLTEKQCNNLNNWCVFYDDFREWLQVCKTSKGDRPIAYSTKNHVVSALNSFMVAMKKKTCRRKSTTGWTQSSSSRKIFISVFLTTFLLGSLLIWAAHSYVSNQTKEKFVSRYSVFTKILAGTLTRLDTSTEDLMLNAAKVIQAKDAELGLLSEPILKDLRDDLKMTHVFVTDANGTFVRSTNESPALIPNLFSFCSDYKKLVAGTSVVEATPVIKPHPEPKPFKFLSIPSRDRKRIIEVGVRVDFIAKTLAEGVSSDTNVLEMSLYGPDGTAFGRFDSKGVEFEHHDTKLPTDLNTVVENSDSFSFFSKVDSSHPRCCQCDVAGTSKNGEYYYVLESKVSKKELKAVLATTSTAFLILGFLNGIISLLLSRFLSRRLVRNVENAARKVQEMKDSGDLSKRIELPGDDEVSFLTQEFDRVLDDLSDSVREIKELASKLKQQSEGGVADVSTAVIFVPILLDELISRKRLEFSDRANVSNREADFEEMKRQFASNDGDKK